MTFMVDLLQKFRVLQRREPQLTQILREYRRMQSDLHRCYVHLRTYPNQSAKILADHLEERYYR